MLVGAARRRATRAASRFERQKQTRKQRQKSSKKEPAPPALSGAKQPARTRWTRGPGGRRGCALRRP